MSTRSEALELLRAQPDTVRPDLAYVVEPFRPEDGEGVSKLFHTVYGDAYPIDLYYVPDALRAACERGDVLPVVGRLPGGEVVGFAALYRSSPPFAGLMEFGLGMVHPAYRGSFLLFHLSNAARRIMEEAPGVQAVFGEAVCDTIITQHSSSLFGFRETALELGLMPGTGTGRVSCLVMFRNLTDRRRPLHCISAIQADVARLASETGLARDILPAGGLGASTRLEVRTFPSAQVMRGNVFSLGSDGAEAMLRAEGEARAEGCRVFQWFLNAGAADAAAGAGVLSGAGYRFGGLAPRWFDDDALLMQKLDEPLDPEVIHLYSDRAREILAMALGGPHFAKT